MRRFLIVLLTLAAACGGSVVENTDTTAGSQGAQTTTSDPSATTTDAPAADTQTTEAVDTTQSRDEADSETSDLPLAPDFTLELGTGGDYTLSDADNPVYLIFWAEW